MRRNLPVPFTLTILSLSVALTACSAKSPALLDYDEAGEVDRVDQAELADREGRAETTASVDLEDAAVPAEEIAVTESIGRSSARRNQAAPQKLHKQKESRPALDGLVMDRSRESRQGPVGSADAGSSSASAGGAVAMPSAEPVMAPPQPLSTTTSRPVPEPKPQPMVVAPQQPGPVFAGEGYTDYGINPFVATGEDHLSTFAVDVDTASYTNTRRKLREGYLPPTSAVRVEEFVNYLPYDYQPPRDGSPFAVNFEAAPSPWNSGYHILEVGVQGKKVRMNERKPVHLTFLIDTSGSMRSNDKLGLVKQAMDMLTRELEDGDTVAIATYAGSTKVVLQPTPVSRRGEILSSLQRLVAGGSTAMASGIDNAYALADSTYVSGHVNRVIVCSDGDANVGTTSHSTISGKIRGYAHKGITLTTLGFGNGNYQDTMMERLANDGDGNYFYIDSQKEARRVLVDKMTSTMEVIAKDVKIQVDFDPDQVLAYRLVGYENRDIADADFRNDKVDAGEIGSGHQVTALYEVQLAPGVDDGWATVRVRAKAPGPDAPATERAFGLSGRDVHAAMSQTSRDFRMALAAGTFADVLRGGADWEGVSLQQVVELARSGKRAEYTEDAELIELIRTAARLRGEGSLAQR